MLGSCAAGVVEEELAGVGENDLAATSVADSDSTIDEAGPLQLGDDPARPSGVGGEGAGEVVHRRGYQARRFDHAEQAIVRR